MAADIRVEVVFALADKQKLTAVTLPRGATVADAIAESLISGNFPDENLERMTVGIWGRVVTREHVLSDGDRVEIYRALELDPRDARRQLALLGRTMADRKRN
ncbi:MAG: RnfH family protein [Gammaproteobacteria bacterium]|nr:RnfH family protein [Gammaproteobacteria bacterium]